MVVDCPFTEQDMQAAVAEWGCNCGPSALAFALRLPLDRVRYAIPGFEAKGYTSPTMMRAALDRLGAGVAVSPPDRLSLLGSMALVRVQFTGPWTAPGANPKWAYWHTHWIATWRGNVFDCNGGIRPLGEWEAGIVPLLTAAIKRADGGWFPTHVWRLAAAGGQQENQRDRDE